MGNLKQPHIRHLGLEQNHLDNITKAAPYATPGIKRKTFRQNITGFFKKPKFSLQSPLYKAVGHSREGLEKGELERLYQSPYLGESDDPIFQGLLDLQIDSSLKIGS